MTYSGTRAAALSYGVLEQLANTVVRIDGKPRRLLDEVDVISSVSGGSFTAAYYALYGDRIFSDFESRFLKKDIQGELAWRLFWPVNWFRLASPTFDRIDMAAKYYDENIFDYHTFGDLVKNGRRPFIVINATDMSLGARFEFTQDQFDWLYSDLSSYRIARAVASSSAFPVLLSPITLQNYQSGTDYQEPGWVENALEDRVSSPPRYRKAMDVRSYRDAGNRRYIHLIDGGISDNIGLRGPLRSLESTDVRWSVLKMLNLEKVDKVVIITVDAKPETDVSWDRCETAPGALAVLSTVASAPMDNYSFDTVQLLKQDINRFRQDAKARNSCEAILKKHCPEATLPGGPMHEVEFYSINVSFDGITDEGERRFFKHIPTSFSIHAETVDRMRSIGKKLLTESGEYQKLLHDLTQ